MLTHILLSGETIEYSRPVAEVARFVERIRRAAEDPTVSADAIIQLVYGPENPLLDTQTFPGRAMVTPAVFANPVFRMMDDYLARKRVALGLVNMDAVKAAHTASVADAARLLNVTSAAIRAAIKARRLAAMLLNGQWWIRPESIASYKVSARGPKRSGASGPVSSSDRAPLAAEAISPVQVRTGSDSSANLTIYLDGGEIIRDGPGGWGQFPANWKACLIRMTTKTGVRVFEIRPAEDVETVEHGKFFVRGRFQIVTKHNSTSVANDVWKAKRVGEVGAKKVGEVVI